MNEHLDEVKNIPQNSRQAQEYVLGRYQKQIDYYWESSKRNKLGYKWTRYLTIILGAIVTIIASLSSAAFIENSVFLDKSFAIATPVLAGILSIVGGLSQTFQWGAAWREMVLTAETLEMAFDEIKVTPPEKFGPQKHLDYLNTLVIKESEGFFSRSLGRAPEPKGANGGVT